MRGCTRTSLGCPRGCVDTDGCGCAWNAPRELPDRVDLAVKRLLATELNRGGYGQVVA